MEPILWEGDPPELRSPTLVCAFAGWNDAASAASTALEAVAASLDPEVAARIDPEEFYDFQVNRPTIRLVEGQTREIDWPANTLLSVRVPRRGARSGAARAGSSRTCAGARSPTRSSPPPSELGVEMVVTLGALMADVAHTRPVPITGLASDPELVERLGLSRSSYEGPTGIVGVRPRRLPAPRHDLGEPLGGRPPLRGRGAQPEGGAGAAAPPGGADRASPSRPPSSRTRAERFDEQVDRAVAANPEIEELVASLEARAGRGLRSQRGPGHAVGRRRSPSDFQRFLRQRGRDEN